MDDNTFISPPGSRPLYVGDFNYYVSSFKDIIKGVLSPYLQPNSFTWLNLLVGDFWLLLWGTPRESQTHLPLYTHPIPATHFHHPGRVSALWSVSALGRSSGLELSWKV